jgi:high-affinity iron transporter
MLIVTGILISFVLVTMVGNTVHGMQAVGWAPVSPIAGLSFPYWLGLWFGLFATWETLFAQVAALVFVVGSYFAAEYLQKREYRRNISSGEGVSRHKSQAFAK